MMIILTQEAAKAVAGESAPGHRLEPTPLRDGSYFLPERVLDDPHHATRHEVLSAFPRGVVGAADRFLPDSETAELSEEDRAAYEWAVARLEPA